MWNNPEYMLPADNKIVIAITKDEKLVFAISNGDKGIFINVFSGEVIECYRWIDSPLRQHLAYLPVEAKLLPHTDPRVEWDDDNLITNDGDFA